MLRYNRIMIQEFTVQGTWSFPGYSDEEFCGTFTYAPSNGGLLQVTGLKKHIKKLFRHVMSNKRQQEIILGKTSYGHVTLVESYYSKTSFDELYAAFNWFLSLMCKAA
jgi:ApeA N-terminal domain 1